VKVKLVPATLPDSCRNFSTSIQRAIRDEAEFPHVANDALCQVDALRKSRAYATPEQRQLWNQERNEESLL